MSVFDDVTESVLEYMLWLMYAETKDVDRMEYGKVVKLLDDAPRPARPESSKIKSSEKDDYSDDDNDLNDIRNLLPQRKDSNSFEESPRPKELSQNQQEVQ